MGKKIEIEVEMNEKKFHLPTLRKSARQLCDVEPKGKKAGDLAKLILRHFVDQGTEKLSCTNCGGVSDETCPCCPYCGMKDEEEPQQALAVAARPMESRLKDLENAVTSIREASEQVVVGFRDGIWKLGEQLKVVVDSKQYLLKHKSFEEFVEANFEFSVAWANKVVKVVETFDKKQVETKGVSALFRLLGEKAEETKEKGKKKPREVAFSGDGDSEEIRAVEVLDAEPSGDTITMVTKVGKKVFLMNNGHGKSPQRAFVDLGGQRPWGMITTENRVNIYLTLVQDKEGLKIYMEEEREGLS